MIDFYNAGMNAFEAKKFEEAYDFFIQEPENPRCAFALGVLFYNGQGVKRDFKTSTHYYAIAAEAGIVPAQVSAGFAYANAMGVPQDFAKAVSFLRPAAEVGEASAKITLAEIYAMGEAGGTRAEAAKLIREVLSFSSSEEAMDIYNKYELHKV
ncbi:MAG: tetratricopeptide repeat protein [Sulfurimonadaceae bacterium]|jgi:TPR repeat protein|nr:tetratricopeptide repeat protein [Sulfurimonadaceae bacterium]